LGKHLNILMVTHHRRFKSRPRSFAMAKALVKRGHQVSLMVIANERKFGVSESEQDGVHVIETPDLLWGQLRSGWDLWGLINRIIYLLRGNKKFDFVHCFETRPGTIYPVLTYCRRKDIPFITDWNDWWGRGGLIDEVRPRWYRILFGSVESYYEEAFRSKWAGTTVISTALAKRAEEQGVPLENICHIPGGTLPDFFLQRKKDVCRKRVGMPLSIPVIGFSSLDSHLDLDIVLQALAKIKKQYPEVQIVITGKTDQRVVEQARSYGVEGNLFLTGFLKYEELPWYLGCADLFVLPLIDKIYNVGRWPNKICDYMSLGRPTLSNPVGDIKALFERFEIGMLAQWDPDDFAEKTIYLLENPDVAKELGQNARLVSVTVYDWDILVRKLEAFYYRILSQRHHTVV